MYIFFLMAKTIKGKFVGRLILVVDFSKMPFG